MKQKPIDLALTDYYKIALGNELTNYLNLSFFHPLSDQSLAELGASYALLFNDQTELPVLSDQTCENFMECLSDISLDGESVFKIVKKMLTTEHPEIKHRSADEFVSDPEILNKTASLMVNIHKNGLQSIITEEMITPPNLSHNEDKVKLVRGDQIGDYLADGLKIFHIPRSATGLNLDIMMNFLISASVLVKSINRVGQLSLFKRYLEKQNILGLDQAVQSLIKARALEVNCPYIPEVQFLLELDYFKVDLNLNPNNSYLCQTLQKKPLDLKKVMGLVMPIIKFAALFMSQKKLIHDKLMSQQNEAYKNAIQLFDNKNYAQAYLELSYLKDLYTPSPTNIDLGERRRFCDILHSMAVCKERMGDYWVSYGLYHQSISVRGHYQFGDAFLYYLQTSKKILELETKISMIPSPIHSM